MYLYSTWEDLSSEGFWDLRDFTGRVKLMEAYFWNFMMQWTSKSHKNVSYGYWTKENYLLLNLLCDKMNNI